VHLRSSELPGLAIAGGLLLSGCGGGGPTPVDPGAVLPELSASVDTPSIAFHLSPGDTVEADAQEQYHAWATGRLGVTLPERVQYYKYTSDAQMRSLTGRGCCFAEPERLAVHTIYPRDNHEVVHVYSARIGTPSNFFNEGLAVAFQTNPAAGDLEPRWNGIPLHDLARSFLNQGTLPPLASMVETEDFRGISSEISYPAAGSLVLFLIEEHGLEALVRFFQGGGGPTESRSHIESNFRSAFDWTLEDAEAAWHARLLRGAAGRAAAARGPGA